MRLQTFYLKMEDTIMAKISNIQTKIITIKNEHFVESLPVYDELFQNPSESMHFEMVEGKEETILPEEYICHNCETAFYKRSEIIKHLKLACCERKSLVTNKVVPILKKLPGLSNSKPSCIKYKKLYHCEICSKYFPNKTKITQHTRTHSGEKPFCCGICGRRFSNSYSLKSHGKTHSGEKPYKCDICQKAFAHSHILINHKRTHSGEKPFKCEFCQKCFTTSGTLVAHKRIHTGEQPYKCDVCQKAFSLSSSLSSHKRTHTGVKPHKCNFCPKAFAKSGDLERHKRTHTGVKPFRCDICDKSFTQSSGLIIHRRIHTGERPFACDTCNRSFTNSASLIAHKRTHTGEIPHMPLHVLNAQQVSSNQNVQKNIFSEVPTTSTTNLWDSGIPTSLVGDFSYSWSNWFQGETDPSIAKDVLGSDGEQPVPFIMQPEDSERRNDGSLNTINGANSTSINNNVVVPIKRPEGRWLDCDVCHKTFPYSSRHKLIEHQRTHTREKPFKCQICQKSFSLSSTLIVHKRMHTGEKPFKCDTCSKAFAQKSKLNIHKRVHTGVKPFRCDSCHKTFAHSSNLADHKKTHTQERPYACDICHKSFTLSNSLRKHKVLHTGYKPYVCEICRKAFAKKASLDRHRGTHEGVPQWTKPFAYTVKEKQANGCDAIPKPYKCHVCFKPFANANGLARHAAKHDGQNRFQCETCNKLFTGLSMLARHKRIHTGEKPFRCDYCPKAFAYSSILVTHKRIHTGEKPYRCDLCPKAYTQSSSLIVHKRTHWNQQQQQQLHQPTTITKPSVVLVSTVPTRSVVQYELQGTSSSSSAVPVDEDGYDADNWSGWYPAESEDICFMANDLQPPPPHGTVLNQTEYHPPVNRIAPAADPAAVASLLVHVPTSVPWHISTAAVQSAVKIDVVSSTSPTVTTAAAVTPQKFKCAKCKEMFDESASLLKHIRKVHRPETASAVRAKPTATEQTANKRKRKRGERQRLECDICQRPFNDSYKLKVHRRTHTREKPFKCDTCGKSFIDTCNLKEHQKVHSGEKLFECDICQKTFLQLGTLTTHRRTHTGEKPYTCDVCGMPFALLSSMKTHKRRAHTGEKPHKCDFCQKSFVKRNDMVRHRRTHTGERPFVCDICQQSFTQSYVLVLHKRNHHPAVGDVSATKNDGAAADNPATAVPKKRGGPKCGGFKCDVCPKTFVNRSTAVAHKLTHANDKPFVALKAPDHHHDADVKSYSEERYNTVFPEQSAGTPNVYVMGTHEWAVCQFEQHHHSLSTIDQPVPVLMPADKDGVYYV